MRLLDDHLRLSASDLAAHLSCRHVTTLDRARAERNLQPPARNWIRIDALQKRGLEHERAYLEHLRAQGHAIVELPESGPSTAELAQRTRQAMAEGADVIAQATLLDGQWMGRADVLLRVDRASALGDWSYEVVDTKLARETRAGTILQLCLYTDLLGRLQGTRPEHLHVVMPLRDFEPETYRTADFMAYYRFVKRRLEETVAAPADDQATYPLPVSHCDICRWWAQCRDRWRDDDHLTLVAGLRRSHVSEIESWGVTTMAALAILPLPLAQQPQRGSRSTYETLREQARLQVQARVEQRPVYELLAIEDGRGLCSVPEPSPGDVFLDLESARFVGDGGLEYLFGYVTIDEAGEAAYHAVWALDREQEKAAFERLMDLILERWDSDPGMHVYHFAPYEPGAFKRLMGRYATRADELDRLLRAGRFVDLFRVFRQGVRAGVASYSLKDLEPCFGYARELDLREASRSLRAIEAALELGDREALDTSDQQLVEAYNRDDCVATWRLRDWLEARRSDLVAGGAAIPRPPPQIDDPPEELSERLQRIRELADRLLAAIPADREARSNEQQACWILAQLLEWHRREDKVSWWELFRLADLDDEERLEEREALSGLQYVECVGGTKRCPIHRYSFPPQEHAIQAGDKARIDAEQRLGSVEQIDDATRTVDIKKRGDTRDLHPTSFFVHSHVPTEVLANSLYRLAEWVAEHGIDAPGPYRAARDLLLQLPPRGLAVKEGSLRWPGEKLLDSSRRLARSLDEGVLAIQGPPGAGKTFTGAHMIVDLVRAGRKVGITAQSHKVIRNLVEGTLKAAAEESVPLRCAQLVRELSKDKIPGLLEVTSNGAIDQGLEDGEIQVVAGTPWLWARAELFQQVDVLVVDEAGQMALANVLAVSQAARSVILIGDPQQLEQPQKATHPDGTGLSALDHLLAGSITVPQDRGLFLERTWRLHPAICVLTSELFYEGRLQSQPGLEQQQIHIAPPPLQSGLHYISVPHKGNQNSSIEEARATASLMRAWLTKGAAWTDGNGNRHPLELDDILIVAPYNAHVAMLAEHLPPGARIGTVDKFQGQEAPIVIYSMASSSPEDAPRGLDFLYSLNRLNVATSRARCACVLVAAPALFEPECRTPAQMRLANGLCRYLELTQSP
ncbi:MAG TPA: TM0106 family RecB-like putative nuclease [Thermoanaerobaculia bacterium]|nr:TM0106 family RecB-like putative nuclease [Thermoanaerobaculia bacterium]